MNVNSSVIHCLALMTHFSDFAANIVSPDKSESLGYNFDVIKGFGIFSPKQL